MKTEISMTVYASEFPGRYETYAGLVSKMPCGRTYAVSGVGFVHAFRNGNGKRMFRLVGRRGALTLDQVRAMILQAVSVR